MQKKKRQASVLRKLRLHHKIFFSILSIVGVILLWRGLWTLFDQTPIINHPYISIIIGLLLIIFSGAFFKLL